MRTLWAMLANSERSLGHVVCLLVFVAIWMVANLFHFLYWNGQDESEERS